MFPLTHSRGETQVMSHEWLKKNKKRKEKQLHLCSLLFVSCVGEKWLLQNTEATQECNNSDTLFLFFPAL